MEETYINKSNITPEQAEQIIAEHERKHRERIEQAERTAQCPVCGAKREREQRMSRYEMDILDFIRSNRLVKRDSCLLCVEGHIGHAYKLFKEMMGAKGSGKSDGTAAINLKLNHLEIIGDLRCAADEAEEYTDLFGAIKQQERQYRYEGIEPDWQYLAALIIEYEQVIAAAGANK